MQTPNTPIASDERQLKIMLLIIQSFNAFITVLVTDLMGILLQIATIPSSKPCPDRQLLGSYRSNLQDQRTSAWTLGEKQHLPRHWCASGP